jgi:hypothetical protein
LDAALAQLLNTHWHKWLQHPLSHCAGSKFVADICADAKQAHIKRTIMQASIYQKPAKIFLMKVFGESPASET